MEGGGFSLFPSSDGLIIFENSTVRECEANRTPLSSERKRREEMSNEEEEHEERKKRRRKNE
jgi:hypothetical protein